MPRAELKANEIGSELIDLLLSNAQISEMRFYRYIKDIEKLNDKASEDYLKALANAAYGRKDTAVDFFEESLKQNNDIYAQNYIVYLNDHGSFIEVYELVNRLAKYYGSRTMVGHAWEVNLFMGDIEQALFYARKFISIVDEKEAEEMKSLAAKALEETDTFKKNSGLTDLDYKDLALRVANVMDKYNVKPVAVEFHSIPEERTSSYVMSVNTNSVDVLSDLNLEIAFSLAENDDFIGKNFSVWFEGIVKEKEDASQ